MQRVAETQAVVDVCRLYRRPKREQHQAQRGAPAHPCGAPVRCVCGLPGQGQSQIQTSGVAALRSPPYRKAPFGSLRGVLETAGAALSTTRIFRRCRCRKTVQDRLRCQVQSSIGRWKSRSRPRPRLREVRSSQAAQGRSEKPMRWTRPLWTAAAICRSRASRSTLRVSRRRVFTAPRSASL